MPTSRMDFAIRALAGATLLAALLAGCGKSAEPEAVPAPPPAQTEAPGTAAPVNPTEVPAAPVQPSPAAPPPKEPSASPTPAAINEPSVESMRSARASAKISVPVDLRYQFDGPVIPGQPVMLHLAAVPRTGGSNLLVSVKAVDGLRVDASPVAVQKVTPAGVYRQQMSITASASAPAAIRVLVTMEMAEGSGFGFFTVPLETGTSAQKQDSVKQR